MSIHKALIESKTLCHSLLESAEEWQSVLWLDALKPDMELKGSQCHREIVEEVNELRSQFVNSWTMEELSAQGRFLAIDIEGSFG